MLVLSSALIVPAVVLASSTGSRSLSLLVAAGAITLWLAFAFSTDRNDAWSRFERFRERHSWIGGFLFSSAAAREQGKRPTVALAVRGLLLAVAGIVGITHF